MVSDQQRRRINEAANRLDPDEVESARDGLWDFTPSGDGAADAAALEELAVRIGALIADFEAAEAAVNEIADEIKGES